VFVHTWDDAGGKASWPLDPEVDLRVHPKSEVVGAESQTAMELVAQDVDVLVGLHMNREFVRTVRLGDRIGRPIVLSEHIDPALPRSLGNFGRFEREVIFSGADGIHVLLDEFRDRLPTALRQRTRVIANSVPRPQRRADVRGTAGGKKVILTVARLAARKNTRHLIEAFHRIHQKHPDWQLHIIGYGPLEAELRKLVSGYAMNDRVTFLGRIEDTYPHYADAHLFAIPSLTEGLPLVVLEALAHGLPVVGLAGCPGVNMLVQPGICGDLVRATHSVEAFADALDSLMSSDELRTKMSEGALARYEEFSMERMLDAWEQMLSEVANLGEPRQAALKLLRPMRWRSALHSMLATPLGEYLEHPLADPAPFSRHT